MKKMLLAGLALAGFTAAYADGAYISAQAGVGGLDTKKYSAQSFPTSSDPYSRISIKNGTVYRLALGLMRYSMANMSVGYEIGYSRLPTNYYYNALNSATDKYNGHYYDLLALTKYNFGSTGFFFLAKGGFARVTQEFIGNAGTATSNKSTKVKYSPEIGIGGGYDMSSHISFDVSYGRIFGDDKADPNGALSQASRVSPVDVVMGGVTFSF